MSTYKNPIIFSIIVAFACIVEFVVVDEEILLMLCFAAFFFNAFVNFGQQAQDSIESRAKAIKAQCLSNLESKSLVILESIEKVEASKKKAMLFFILESTLNKLLRASIYLETIQLFQKCHVDSSQIIYQRYLARNTSEEAKILRALPFSVKV